MSRKTASFELQGDGGSILVEILGYERPGASDPEDANWLLCRAAVTAGGFSGEFNASFETRDIQGFLQEGLAAVEKDGGAAQFSHIEDALRFEVTLENTGRAKVVGQAKVLDVSETVLSFVFPTDQARLTKTLESVEKALRLFPVRS